MATDNSAISGYDAAQDSGVRSLLIFPTNSRVEHGRTTRRRLVERNRALEGNFAPATRIRSKFGRCVAGKGIFPFPVTRDAEWNQLAKDYFERWASNPYTYSVDASRDFWEDQRIAAEELGAGDGEVFSMRVRREGMLMIQALDVFEIESPRTTVASSRWEDGVLTDEYLRPIAYSVRELPAPGSYNQKFRTVAAGEIIHVFRRRRAKHLRGLPPLYSGLNDGNDALDMLALEKATDKLHAMLGVSKVVKEQNKAGTRLGDQIKKALNTDGGIDRLEEFFKRGAATVELSEGESLQLHTSNRPGNPFIEGIKLYCSLLSLGADLPFSVTFSFAGMGGTPTRAELEDAQNTFEMGQDRVVWRQSQPTYVWVIADAMQSGRLPRCRDPFWWTNDWHGPAKITVDYGRSAQANIDLMKSGMLSIPRYAEERGWDADAEMRKQVDWLKRAQDYCAAQGVEFSRFMEATPGAVTNVNMPEAQPAE